MRCRGKIAQGLTLIEVLIALAIISIAMMAVIQAVSQNIRSTSYLREKTIALWVGQQALNEIRVGVRKITAGQEQLKYQTTFLDRTWYWHLLQFDTPNARIKRVEVRVFPHEADNDEETSLVSLETFIYLPEAK